MAGDAFRDLMGGEDRVAQRNAIAIVPGKKKTRRLGLSVAYHGLKASKFEKNSLTSGMSAA